MPSGQWLTLADLTSRMNGAMKQVYIAEQLSQANEVWDDLPLIEANEIGGHEFVYRTSIPTGIWRQINQGVPYGKSTTAKGRVGIGSLEGYSQLDRMLLEDSGDIEEARRNEDVAFLEGFSQTMVQTIFYGNTAVTPAEVMGLAPFYNTVNTANAANAQNVIDCGGTGTSNTSMWLMGMGERTIYGLYPRGSKAGLISEDKADTVPGFDALGNRFEAYTTYFRHQMAIAPQDWRYGVRMANIDTTTAGLAGPNAVDIFATLSQAFMLLPTLTKMSSGITRVDAPDDPSPGIRPVIWCNRTVRHWMDVQGMRDRNVLLTLNDAAGKPQDVVRGIPVKIVDQLVNTESRVV